VIEIPKILLAALKLGPRGKRMYENVLSEYPNLNAVQQELLVEGCRIVDQLELLHDITRGDAKAWAFVKMPRGGGDIYIEVDQVLDKQRQLQLALKNITATLTVAGEGSGKVEPQNVSDELREKREQRRASS